MLKGLVKKLIGIAEGNIRISRNDRNAPFSRSSVFRLFEATKGIVFPSSRAKVRDERGVCVCINVVVITLSLWHAANFISSSKIRFSWGAIYLLNLLSLLRNNA